ncbi:MAG: hypothetical protein HY778_08990 [Betaproteobacteria bacterium]|nr:hypothetical protein [Betaproteobacteria bacterium]
MAFDGPMLAASVVQAIAAIPGAIRELHSLLSTEKTPDKKQALDCLDDLKTEIRNLASVQHSLREAKEIHDALHYLDSELEGIRIAYDKSIASSRFVPHQYELPEVRRSWQTIKKSALPILFSRATGLKFIELSPLVLDANGGPLSGPDWAIRLIEMRGSIDQYFSSLDSNGLHDIKPLVDEFDRFASRVKELLEMADIRILKEADFLSRKLVDLTVALR